MALSPQSMNSIELTIKDSLRKKFQNYKPESKGMPFHFKLLGKDRMALYSFIQSLNTTFGTSIFEPVAVTLAKTRFKKAQSQYIAGNQISQEAQNVIQNIMNDLSIGKGGTDKTMEIERIRGVCQKGNLNTISTVKVDLFTEDKYGALYLFDLKTALVHKSKSRRNPSIGTMRLGNFVALRHTQVRHSVESRATD